MTTATRPLADDTGRHLKVARILLERLSDDLGALDRSVRSDDDLDRDDLREQVDGALGLAFLTLDELSET